MDFSSSPLPSSGMPGPTPSSPSQSSSITSRRTHAHSGDPRSVYKGRRRAQDMLAIDADIGVQQTDTLARQDVTDVDGDDRQRRRNPNRARNQQTLTANIPPVKDATGEAVTTSFEEFLSRCVIIGFLIHNILPSVVVYSTSSTTLRNRLS
jgi:hypothetical protein